MSGMNKKNENLPTRIGGPQKIDRQNNGINVKKKGCC